MTLAHDDDSEEAEAESAGEPPNARVVVVVVVEDVVVVGARAGAATIRRSATSWAPRAATRGRADASSARHVARILVCGRAGRISPFPRGRHLPRFFLSTNAPRDLMPRHHSRRARIPPSLARTMRGLRRLLARAASAPRAARPSSPLAVAPAAGRLLDAAASRAPPPGMRAVPPLQKCLLLSRRSMA